MVSRWRRVALGFEATNPEAHWLETVSGGEGHRPVSVRMGRLTARDLVARYGMRYQIARAAAFAGSPTDDIVAVLADHATLDQGTFDTLWHFADSSSGPHAIEITFLVDPDGLATLAAAVGSERLELLEIGQRLGAIAQFDGHVVDPADDPGNAEPTELEGDEIIVATIDDGIGFANARFRLSVEETRVEYFWDMPSRLGGTGRVLRKRDIDTALRECDCDEEAIYRRFGLIDHSVHRRLPLKFAMTHGTHVLDVATGYDFGDMQDRTVAAKRPIIAVQLPSDVIAERSDALMPVYLTWALGQIAYLARQLALRIARRRGRSLNYLPLVVNFSFGAMGGPHDGEAPIELAIRSFVENYRALPGGPACEVVVPVGNGFLSRNIAKLKIAANRRLKPLPWRVQPDDKTSSYVQIWLPASAESQQQIAVALQPPRGGPARRTWSKLGEALDWEVDGVVLARLYHLRVGRPNGLARERIVIAIRATEPLDEPEPCSPAGLWWIHFKDNGLLSPGQKLDIRIQRDDSLYGQRPTGRQSYFDHPDYVRFEEDNGRVRIDPNREIGPVTRRGTFNAYASGPIPIVVGGYRRSDGFCANYSGAGPTDLLPGPTVAAVCEESPAHRGTIATGTYSGSRTIMNGTSVATPAVTRMLADVLAGGGRRDDLVRAIQQVERAGISGPRGPYPAVYSERQGAGRLFSSQIHPYRRRVEG